jgi:hypothetical protein
MDQHRGVSELAKIPRSSRMIKNNLLVKLFEFLTHEKNRAAA